MPSERESTVESRLSSWSLLRTHCSVPRMCSAAHVQANNISGGWVYPALCDSPLTSVAALVWTTCKHTTPRSPDFMPALKHSWTLFSSTLSTATPLTQLLSSQTSHAAYFFLSLCALSHAGLAWFQLPSLKQKVFFFLYIILSLFDVCSRHLWTNNFPSFFIATCLCSFVLIFFFPCMYNKVTGPYLTIFSSTHQLFMLFLSNKLLKRCD